MTRAKVPFAVAALSIALAPGPWAAGQAKVDPQRSRLPAAVARAVDENRPGAEIDKLEIEKEAGITLYDIEFKGDAGEIEVAEDGTVLDVTSIVDIKDVPAPAAAVLQKGASHGIRRVEKSEVRHKIITEGGRGELSALATPEYIYEAELVHGGEIEVAADGRIIKAPKFIGKARD